MKIEILSSSFGLAVGEIIEATVATIAGSNAFYLIKKGSSEFIIAKGQAREVAS